MRRWASRLFRQIAAVHEGAVLAPRLEIERFSACRVSSRTLAGSGVSLEAPFAASVRNASAASFVGTGSATPEFFCPIASVTLAFNSFGHIFRNSPFDG
jgi:hypothetical protein